MARTDIASCLEVMASLQVNVVMASLQVNDQSERRQKPGLQPSGQQTEVGRDGKARWRGGKGAGVLTQERMRGQKWGWGWGVGGRRGFRIFKMQQNPETKAAFYVSHHTQDSAGSCFWLQSG